MIRLLTASSVLALALALPAVARADIPPPADGGTTSDPDCTVGSQSVDGTTCALCTLTTADTDCQTQVGSEYNYVCQHSPTEQVWCNGPDRNTNPTIGCALGAPSGTAGAVGGGAGFLVLAGAAAWALRRRRP